MIGNNGALPLPMSGSLPPDLQGTLLRVGPSRPWGTAPASGARWAAGEGEAEAEAAWRGGEKAGAVHAVELRDGKAVWYRRQESDADAGVLWHAGSVLALPETGIPSQYSRFLEPEEFAGRLTVPIASHVHRLASDGGRVLFGVDDGSDDLVDGGSAAGDGQGILLRIGEWDAAGALRSAQSVELERATWQHDIGVTGEHVVFIESPTTRLGGGGGGDGGGLPVPFGWVPGTEGWLGVVPRGGDGSVARWIRLDPSLGRAHVLGAYDEPQGWCPGRRCCGRRCCGRRCCGRRCCGRRCDRPLCLPIWRSRGRSGDRPLHLGGRPGGHRAHRNRGDAGRAGTLAHRGRADRADPGRRTSHRVSKDGCPMRGCLLPVRLRTRDGMGRRTARQSGRGPSSTAPVPRGPPPVGVVKFDLARTRSHPGARVRGARRANHSSSGRWTATATTRGGCSPSSTTPTAPLATSLCSTRPRWAAAVPRR